MLTLKSHSVDVAPASTSVHHAWFLQFEFDQMDDSAANVQHFGFDQNCPLSKKHVARNQNRLMIMMRNPWKPRVLFMEIWRMAQIIVVSFLSADNPGCSEYVSSHLYISEHSAPHQCLHFHGCGFSSTRPHLNPFFRRFYCEQQMLRNHYPKPVRSTAPTPYP